ncbi:putative reverse transcriptase domain-containing protein [Tanacetum coccineum]
MENLPPPNNDPNVLKDEHAPTPEHAPIAPNPAPIQLNDYLADNEESKEEEEHILEQAPAALDGFAPQWIKEEDDEEMEDEEEEEIVTEDEAEIIYPYDEAETNNRPPPALDDESEFAPSVIPVFDAENRPVPPVIYFSSTYELGESYSAREILKDIREVCPLGLVPPTIGTAMRRIRKLNEQMRERAKVDERIMKKIDRNNLRIWMVGRDAISLDGAIKECRADVSKVISMMESMSLEFDRFRIGGGFVKTSTCLFLGPFPDDPYVQARNAAMADDDVEDDDVEDEDDMDDDTADLSDPQFSELPRSLSVIAKLVVDEVAKALAADRATRNTTGAGGSGNNRGVEGAIELCRWFEKIECTFRISECADRNKVRMMLEEFCPEEEISRMEDELRHLRLKDNDLDAYTNRFNELVLLCPNVVPTTKQKIGQYIKGLPLYIKGETYSSKPTTLNEAIRMAHGLMEHKIQG